MRYSGSYHEPVLTVKVKEYLALSPGKRIWDATVGTGGHSEAIVREIIPGGHLYCSDRDAESLEVSRDRLSVYGDNISYYELDFRNVGLGVKEFSGFELDGILLDFGISTYQMSGWERGFSFQVDGPLDMRMDRRQELTAAEVVNTYDYMEIKRILKEYGEEPAAARIARRIVETRKREPLQTTAELARLVVEVVSRRRGYTRIHPATRTFQAIRIAVNGELENLALVLEGLSDRLRKGGRFVVISFHSLEDRIVKTVFRDLSRVCQCPEWFPVCKCGHEARVKLLTSRVIRPEAEEVEKNAASRSARLRAVEKIA